MTVVPTRLLLSEAYARGSAVCAVNAMHLESVEGLIRASENVGADVIIQISQRCVEYHGSLDPLALAVFARASASSARIAVHLDHAESHELIDRAIELGFGSVMYDGSRLPYRENVEATRRVVERSHAAGVAVEAELGEIGGKDGAHFPGVRTDPQDAHTFVEDTGVDALAVAVGSSHAMVHRTAVLDEDLIGRLRTSVDVPLVLHGTSGVTDESIERGVRAGLTKINFSTRLVLRFTEEIRDALAAEPDMTDSRIYMGHARDGFEGEATRILRLLQHA